MDPRKTTLTCYHCGNTGLLTYIKDFMVYETYVQRDQYGQIIFEETDGSGEKWYICQCPVCETPVLAKQYEPGRRLPDGYRLGIDVVYPGLGITKAGVPTKIFLAYEAAVKNRCAGNANCLLAFRRVLEMVCKDKNAKGKNLESKIDDLIEKKVLPEMMRDACWIVRQCGNEAAHADDVEFSNSEVTEVIEYVGSVINYLYSTPVKVADLRRRIEERQKKRKEQKQEQNNVDCEENNG